VEAYTGAPAEMQDKKSFFPACGVFLLGETG